MTKPNKAPHKNRLIGDSDCVGNGFAYNIPLKEDEIDNMVSHLLQLLSGDYPQFQMPKVTVNLSYRDTKLQHGRADMNWIMNVTHIVLYQHNLGVLLHELGHIIDIFTKSVNGHNQLYQALQRRLYHFSNQLGWFTFYK
jgi:hypothetical protein